MEIYISYALFAIGAILGVVVTKNGKLTKGMLLSEIPFKVWVAIFIMLLGGLGIIIHYVKILINIF